MISYVIVTYNSADSIASCLEGISHNPGNEIIIVDNSSQDDTKQIVQNFIVSHPEISITFSPQTENVGFTKGCNIGARLAKQKYVFFLNPDTSVKTDAYDTQLTRTLKKLDDMSIVGFHFVYPDNTLQPSFGRFPTLARVLFDRIPFLRTHGGIQERDPQKYITPQNPDWISFSGALVSKNLYTKLGGLNESIFMYGEDIDFCYRAKQAGAIVSYEPNITFYHRDTGTTNSKRKPHKYFYMRIGLLSFFSQYRSKLAYSFFLGMVFAEALFVIVFKKSDWKKYARQLLTHTYA